MSKTTNKRYLSIKQFAEMCRTTKHTLIHYDEIGILKPDYVGENSYRFYSLNQAGTYDVISFLKEMGLTLKEIQAYLEEQNIIQFLELLRQKEAELETERKQLEIRKKMLGNMIASAIWAQKEDCGNISIEKKGEEYLISTELPKGGDDLQCLSRKYEQLSYCRKHDFFTAQITGHIVEKDCLLQGDYANPRFFFSMVDQKVESEYLHIKPAGLYASLLHKGPRENICQSYDKLKEYLFQYGYTIIGNAYEFERINYMQSGDCRCYRTVISIEIKKIKKGY